jgi:hypothetical protein
MIFLFDGEMPTNKNSSGLSLEDRQYVPYLEKGSILFKRDGVCDPIAVSRLDHKKHSLGVLCASAVNPDWTVGSSRLDDGEAFMNETKSFFSAALFLGCSP